VENKMIKKANFEIEWEIVSIGGKPYLLLKDLLKYFGYSTSSQGAFIDQVKDKNKIMLSGEPTKSMTHITGRGWIVDQKGLTDFVKSRKGTDKYFPGVKLVNWLSDVKDAIKNDIPVPGESLIGPPAPRKNPDLFDIAKDQEIEELKKVAHLQSDRIDSLEKRIQELEKKLKDNAFGQVVKSDGEKKLIDADAFIHLLQSTGVTGNPK
jgi:hypothetical protein